ncbi:MAG: alkaline phosphatase D family protein [Candidatus Binatia bacterium]
MSGLRLAGLGPIVGHTSSSTCRIWIRAGDPHDQGAELASGRRTLGVAAVCEENGNPIQAPEVYYFRLHREFDRTGTLNFGDEVGIVPDWDPATRRGKKKRPVSLKADTRYAAVVGTLTIDDPFGDDETVTDDYLAQRLPDPNNLRSDLLKLLEKDRNSCVADFRTFPDTGPKKTGPLSFIVGSCRYPGLLWKAKEADRIFGPLYREALGEEGKPKRRPVEFTIMVGDQIYADMLNRHVPVGLADTFEEFQERYLTAFGSPNMRALLRRVPTYMILDDHEIEDNWTQDRIFKAESRRVFNVAISAYMSYQWSHGPRTFGRRLYYSFECGGYPFFVLDTRTQRFIDDVEESLEDNHMLGKPSMAGEEPSQLERLILWLCERQKKDGDVPKFIASSSVFVPNPMSARTGRKGPPQLTETDPAMVRWMQDSDSWPAFPRTRRAILRAILDNGIQNVVFLSGDIHSSNVAEMRFRGAAAAAKLRAFSITSSAFYWPFFFADGDPSGYVHDSTKKDQLDTFPISQKETMDYEAWNFTQEDNYCRIDVDPSTATITVRPYDTEGNLIRKRNWLDQPTDRLIAKLQLARW